MNRKDTNDNNEEGKVKEELRMCSCQKLTEDI